MSRRRSLPGAAELFRSTTRRGGRSAQHRSEDQDADSTGRDVIAPQRRGTPRQKHTSKITVYVSDEELLALEHARLALRATHGLAVDRGRVVREAVAVLLADLEAQGEDSVLVQRLRQDTGK